MADKIITFNNLKSFKQKFDTAVAAELSKKQDIITDLEEIRTKVNEAAPIESLSGVALSGDYEDLVNKPEEASQSDIEDLFPEVVASLADIKALNSDPSVDHIYVMLTDDISAGNDDIVFRKNAAIDLNRHELKFDDWGLEVRAGASLTVANGEISSSESAFYVREQAALTINSGNYTTTNNFVIGTNGNSGKGDNTITINGGTFNGSMSAAGKTAGYIACGIYVANSDTLIVKSGVVLNVEDGCGICARSGHTILEDGVIINATGTGSGKVGDSPIQVPMGAKLVLDLKADYPGGKPDITIGDQLYDEEYVLAHPEETAAAGIYVLKD